MSLSPIQIPWCQPPKINEIVTLFLMGFFNFPNRRFLMHTSLTPNHDNKTRVISSRQGVMW